MQFIISTKLLLIKYMFLFDVVSKKVPFKNRVKFESETINKVRSEVVSKNEMNSNSIIDNDDAEKNISDSI